MTLNIHSFDSRCDFDFVVVAIDSEIFNVIPNSFMAVVLINGIGVLLSLVLRSLPVRRDGVLMASRRSLTVAGMCVMMSAA